MDTAATPASDRSVASSWQIRKGSLAGPPSLGPFFHPEAVAVIGASPDPGSIGYRLLDSLLRGGFAGPVFPVNPKAKEIHGLPAFASARQLPAGVDLAVIAVPPKAVLEVVEDCAARNICHLVVITAGFAEIGADGASLQRQLLDKVRSHGMRLIGPNCLGLLSNELPGRLNATFVPLFPPPGRVAMSSDSGALGVAVLATAARLGLGISSCVSVGNRADVSSNDLLEYWEGDDATEVILLYLESFGNPRRFARIARRVSRRKPIVAVKAGTTKAGRRAAGSHTAALAARDVAVEALFHQTGIIRADTLQEMFDLVATLASQPLPGGPRVAIMTNAGGPAILCADACEAAGLEVPELSKETRAHLAAFLPPTASLGNPIDMIASATPADFGRTAQILAGSGECDALIGIAVAASTWQTEEVASAIQEGARIASSGVPVLLCLIPDLTGLHLTAVGQEQLPCFPFPEAPARVLGKLVAYAKWRAQPLGKTPRFEDMDLAQVRSLCAQEGRASPGRWLSTETTRTVLRAAGLPVSPGQVVKTPEEAVLAARALGFPVALKLASRQILHKTEIGGVHLDLKNGTMVRQAFEAMRARLAGDQRLDAMEGVLVQPMFSGGAEILIGVTHDPLFGPLIAFGLGGIHVEILGDVCFRVTPLTDRDAAEMVQSICGYRLLQGYRGHPAADLTAIEDILLRVSRLIDEIPEIVELDLNPVMALPPGQGCRIVDARIRVQTSAECAQPCENVPCSRKS